MEIKEVINVNGVGFREWLIRITERDLVISNTPDLHISFWKMMDKVAEHMGIKPFCPCRERPHRLACPLGFDNYFPLQVAGGKSERPHGD